ncbi:porin family protein [Chryseobacterium sp. Mn2064]|uniref:porin family protein n=1 Tax=Chryseobacterium sp. Mn2064 TaxID=3395263 RepID=UPI003BE1B6AC
MKKIFFSLALVAGSFAFAQSTSNTTTTPSPSSSPIKFGLKAGLNVSTVSNMDMKAKAGFYGGIFANIPVTKDFSVQPEVMYSAVGGILKENSSTKLNLEYLSVPVMFQYNALPNLYIEAGPQFNFLIDARLKKTASTGAYKNGTKSFDFGIGLGAGYYITRHIGVNVRYVAGLSDIVKTRYYYGYDNTNAVKNGVFQIGASYKF